LTKNDEVIRLGYAQEIYLADCLTSFDYYFSAVKPSQLNGRLLADFSTPRFHKIIGFDYFPILFPSIPEPYVTLDQYLTFARLEPGNVVFDLGVYAGLTSIVFSRLVGPEGAVFGFEADSTNFAVALENLETARQFGAARNTTLIPKAVWCHADGVEFSVEGAMGSGAASIVGVGRGGNVHVPTTTLPAFGAEHGIDRVDFIKMDIEGAEVEVLDSSGEWLSRMRPRLIIEPHVVGGVLTTDRCCSILRSIGYRTRVVGQYGGSLPLIEAMPSDLPD
jgi:FkbM family methyltransferase